jgi:hypothetical protein
VALLATWAVMMTALLSSAVAHAEGSAGSPHRRTVSIDLQVLPPIHQRGPVPAASRGALTVLTAAVSPPRAGRTVTLQRRGRSGWRTSATRATTADGLAEFFVPQGRAAAYRAVALSSNGRVEGSSEVVDPEQWGAADFVEEFAGETLGPAWQHRIQFYNPWGGRACSKGSPAAVRAGEGVVHLSSLPDPEAVTPCPATDVNGSALGEFSYRLNGHISTQDSFDFLYGVAAARMRFQREPGAHPSFWLQPRGLLTHAPTPWGAEIDVVEWFGRLGNRDRMASTVHAPLPSGDKRHIGGTVVRPSRFLESRSDTWWRNYHVFSVEWTPTSYVFMIDGHEMWHTDEGISHDPEFLILSMLSSDFELPRLGERESYAQTATVDWVKVWEADPAPSLRQSKDVKHALAQAAARTSR